jgi:hypothetical protein
MNRKETPNVYSCEKRLFLAAAGIVSTITSNLRSQSGVFLRIGLIALVFVFCGCSRAAKSFRISRVPGTERASPTCPGGGENDALTVSPDEKWLVFWEAPAVDSLTLSSVNLQTSKKTMHDISDLPMGIVTRGYSQIGGVFNAASWHGGLFYIELGRRSGVIVINPDQPSILTSTPPIGEMSCSDCPPTSALREAASKRTGYTPWSPGELLKYTIAWRDGTLGRDLYRLVRGTAIVRIGPDGAEEPVLERKRAFRRTVISHIRVSPDETCLAFAVFSKLAAPLPLPGGHYDVYVRQLQTGVEKWVATHYHVSNLIWSSDSSRIYFAGNGEDGDDPAVYCVDIADALGR